MLYFSTKEITLIIRVSPFTTYIYWKLPPYQSRDNSHCDANNL